MNRKLALARNVRRVSSQTLGFQPMSPDKQRSSNQTVIWVQLGGVNSQERKHAKFATHKSPQNIEIHNTGA